jgi:8-oxo-dGTP pyrophosphatase MutT (NUDIX family)
MTESAAVPRPAAKVILIDNGSRVLLFRGGDPARPEGGTWWFPTGGGVETGETVVEAARREVLEETGLDLTDLGPIVAHRSAQFMFDGQLILSEEDYFVVRVPPFDISQAGWTTVERVVMVEHRWWTLDELRVTTDTVYPEGLIDLIETFFS